MADESEPQPLDPIVDTAGFASPAQLEEVGAGNFLTVPQLALELHFNQAYISRLCKDGRIKAVKPVGGQWRIPSSETARLQKEGIPPPLREAARAVQHVTVGQPPPLAEPEPVVEEPEKNNKGWFDDLIGWK